MISARDIHWDELEDAHGKAGRIPDLLNEAFKDKASKIDTQSGPWFDLWSRLFHQGSVYTASYAAVPMIVEAIKKADGPIAMDYFLLPVSIELARRTTLLRCLRILPPITSPPFESWETWQLNIRMPMTCT
jgi:hypothetical protein